jgi:hypothetical protein
MSKVLCDLCGHEIIATVTKSNTEFFSIDSTGKLKEQMNIPNQFPGTSNAQTTSYHCSNSDCGQKIGDIDYLKFYKGNSDPDEFRLFKQLDKLQDVIEELCRMQLHTNSLNASVVIRNTLKNLPEKLPIIIDMKRKMVEGDFIDQSDLDDILNKL